MTLSRKMSLPEISVEVVCATAQCQRVAQVRLPVGATIVDAVVASGLAAEFPELDFAALPVGVFSRQLPSDTQLCAGDRVEIYRPLPASPNSRRQSRVK